MMHEGRMNDELSDSLSRQFHCSACTDDEPSPHVSWNGRTCRCRWAGSAQRSSSRSRLSKTIMTLRQQRPSKLSSGEARWSYASLSLGKWVDRLPRRRKSLLLCRYVINQFRRDRAIRSQRVIINDMCNSFIIQPAYRINPVHRSVLLRDNCCESSLFLCFVSYVLACMRKI